MLRELKTDFKLDWARWAAGVTSEIPFTMPILKVFTITLAREFL